MEEEGEERERKETNETETKGRVGTNEDERNEAKKKRNPDAYPPPFLEAGKVTRPT